MISIVMPTFKQSLYIDDAVDSILSQSYKDIELIIVPVVGEKTVKRVASYKDKRVRVVVANYANITYQMNIGAFAARGEYFMYFASDDYLLPGILDRLYNYSVKKKAALVYPDFYISNRGLEKKKIKRVGNHSLSRLQKECYITDVSFCKRDIFMKYLPMKFSSGRFRIWDVWKKIAEDGNKIKHFTRPAFIYRQYDKQIHRNKSQKDFSFVGMGKNKSIKILYENIPRIKKRDMNSDNYSIYFFDVTIFLNDMDYFEYKKITLHWDKDNIFLVDKIIGLNHVYNATHDKEVLNILREKKLNNIYFIKDKKKLINYLSEEKYK